MTTPAVSARPHTSPGLLLYVAPISVFLSFGLLEENLPRIWYPIVYCAKVGAVTLALVLCRKSFSDLRPSRRVVVPAVLTGVAVWIAWVGLDSLLKYPHLGTRVAFNPFQGISNVRVSLAFIAIRLYGLALLVPVMEELFWRAFLLRYLTRNDFGSVPLHAFSWTAFWCVAGAFGTAHPEWLAAILTACAYGLLLRWTRSVFATVIAHATTNTVLGAYVLATHNWAYW